MFRKPFRRIINLLFFYLPDKWFDCTHCTWYNAQTTDGPNDNHTFENLNAHLSTFVSLNFPQLFKYETVNFYLCAISQFICLSSLELNQLRSGWVSSTDRSKFKLSSKFKPSTREVESQVTSGHASTNLIVFRNCRWNSASSYCIERRCVTSMTPNTSIGCIYQNTTIA